MKQLACASRGMQIPFLGLAMAVAVAVIQPASVFGAAIIVNEYNAVAGSEWLDGNDGTAEDTYFGRVEGNGGDWFELVVIQDYLDIRGWSIDLWEDGELDETLVFTQESIWSDLRSGTIITIAEDEDDDTSYDPAGGDWWINVMANSDHDGPYITNANIKINEKDMQFEIFDASDASVFGPVGEGVQPSSGVSDKKVWKLETAPSTSIVPTSPQYNDGTSSTFGSPNIYGGGLETQDFSALRAVVPEPGSLILLACSALALLMFRRQ